MHAMQVYTGRKQIRSARQRQRRQISPITSAPGADAAPIHIRAAPQIKPRAYHVVVLARASRTKVQRLPEVQSVADAATIVDGHYYIAAARKILVHRVSIGVVA